MMSIWYPGFSTCYIYDPVSVCSQLTRVLSGVYNVLTSADQITCGVRLGKTSSLRVERLVSTYLRVDTCKLLIIIELMYS